MLDSFRKRQNNFVFTFLLLACAAAMCFFGVNKFASDPGGDAAAVVNGDIISKRDFQQALEMRMMQYQQMLGAQYDEKFLTALQVPQRTLEELIQFKLLAQQAKRLNIVVPDQELADYIRSLPYYQKDGKFAADLYAQIPNVGVEERRQRERLQTAKLQNYLVDRIQLTPAAARAAFDLRETKVELEYAKIDLNELAEQQAPSKKEIDEFLKTGKDTEFTQYYEAHKKDFTDKAQVKLKQLRVGIPYQAKESQKMDAKKKIDEIAKTIKPEDFSKVAKAKSDDDYAKKGGEVGWITRGTLEPQLEMAIDKLKPGQVSQPIETSFGYFLLLVTDTKPEKVHPLAEVKRQIAEKLVAEKNTKSFVDAHKAEWDKLLAAGKPIEPELKKYKIELRKTGPFSIGQGSIPSIGAAENIVDAVFGLTMKAPVAKQLLPYGTAYYYIKLKSIERPKAEEFAKNRESVERTVENSLQAELMTKWVADLQKNASVKTEVQF